MYETHCPFCGNGFRPADVLHRPYLRHGMPTLPDEHIARFFGGQAAAPPLPDVLTREEADRYYATGKWPVRSKSGADGRPKQSPATFGSGILSGLKKLIAARPNAMAGEWVCPKCHLPISLSIADGKRQPQSLAIVGSVGAGKSNWIAVLVGELKRHGSRCGYSFRSLPTWGYSEQHSIPSTKLFNQRYGGLIPGGCAIPKTPPDVSLKIPLLYRLEFDDGRVLDLTLYDAAGEFFGTAQQIDEYVNYVKRAAGVIFLLDPMQIAGFAERLAAHERPEAPQTAPTVDDVSAVNALSDYAEATRTSFAKVPAALVFAKSDEFRPYLPEGHALHAPDGDAGFDDTESLQIHAQMSAEVAAWGGHNELKILTGLFPRNRVFAVSALGRRPRKPDGYVGLPNPHRVADPVLWVLSELGHLRNIA